MNSKSILTIASRFVALAAIVEVLISYSLWFPQREFPILPLITFPTAFLNFEDFLAPLLLLALIIHAAGFFLRASAISAVLFFLLAIILDITRVQPWVYQYILMFTAFVFATKKNVGENQQKEALCCFQIIIASIYIWSGLHKFNLFFPLSMVPWLFEPIITNQSQFFALFIIFSFLLPPLEVLLGIGLFIKNYRRIAIIGLCLMHAIILYTIGPLGHSWNEVVWPWNILMMVMIILLFWKAEEKACYLIKLNLKNVPFLVILFLSSIAPAFNFINLWPSYLSWALYSSDTYQAQISLPQEQLLKLPEVIQRSTIVSAKEEESLIDIISWSEAVVGVPLPPEVLNYLAAGKYFCKLLPDNTALKLIIFDRPSRLSLNRASAIYNCEDIRMLISEF